MTRTGDRCVQTAAEVSIASGASRASPLVGGAPAAEPLLDPEAVDTMKGADVASLITRIRAEYIEMPGLALTERELCRLAGLDTVTCETIFRMLTEQQFLVRTAKGTYVRAGDDV